MAAICAQRTAGSSNVGDCGLWDASSRDKNDLRKWPIETPQVAPAALLMPAASLMLWLAAPELPTWGNMVGLRLAGRTPYRRCVWWDPLMARLEVPGGALDRERYQLMLATLSVRVGIITACAFLVSWMVGRSARGI